MSSTKDYYFPHDFHAGSHLAEIQMKHGTAGVGVFWLLVEWFHQNGGVLPKAKLQNALFALRLTGEEMKIAEDILNNPEFFEDNGDEYTNPRIMDNLQKLDDIKEARKTAGRRSGESRREKAKNKTEPAPEPEPAPEGVGCPTFNELSEYALNERLVYVNVDRFYKFCIGKIWHNKNEWRAIMKRWDEEDKAKRAPLPKAGGSFDTDEFFGTAVRNSYKEAK